MNFNLSEENLELKQMAREFADKRLYPHGEEYDEKEALPTELISEAAELGYLGFTAPEEYGGLGLSASTFMGVLEELSGGSAAFGMMLTAHCSLCCEAITRFGSDELKKRILPQLASGDKIGAYCLAEPSAGTDIGSIQSIAALKDGNYVLSGTKAHVTNGSIANVLIVYARTGNGDGTDDISCFVIDKDSDGITVGKADTKCGVKASDTRSITFKDVSVPKENLLGNESGGFKMITELLNSGRISVAFQAVGIAQAALIEATKYAQVRRQFDRPISDFQAIKFKLSDMATRIDAGRLLAYRAAQLKDENKPCHREVSMAKLFCAEAANYVCNEAVQIHGGYGYIKEYPVERYFRDARVTEINDGTAEAQRIVIAADILKDQKLA